jgi:dTDP-4-dehydrorhamnose 3,5-epimerase
MLALAALIRDIRLTAREKLMPTVRKLAIPGVLEIETERRKDERGFFSETYNRAAFKAHGIDVDWMQDNQSYSRRLHTLRGLHFQRPPFAQAKLVRVLKGRIFDVVVDIRRGSPTYGRWVSVELSAESFNQLFVPVGFAHGFLTLTADCEVFYKVSNPYSARESRSIRFDDPAISIDWPLSGASPALSAADASAPRIADVDNSFEYAGEGR